MLRCTGRAYPARSCTCSPSSSGWLLIWRFPDPAYPDSSYYVDVARQLAARPRLQRRLHLDLPRGRRHDPGRTRSCRSPRTPTGCRSRRSSRSRSSGSFGRRRLGVGAAVRAHRRDRGAADLGDRARRRRAAGRRGRRRRPDRDPGCCRPSTWPSRTTSRSTSRSSSARCGWPRAACAGRRGRSSLAGLLAGLATLVAERRPARARRARRSSFLWDRWRAWRSAGGARARDPVRGGGRVRRAVRPGHGARGGPASSPSSARSRRRPRRARSCSSATSASGTASRRRPRSTTCSGWGSGRCCATPRRRARSPPSTIFIDARRRRSSSLPFDGDRRRGRGGARRTSGRSSSTPRSCSRSPRSSRPSTCRAGRSSTRRSRSRRTATSWRSRAIVVAVAWVAARRSAWDAETAHAACSAARRRVRGRRRGRRLARRPRDLGRPARDDCRTVAAALDAAGAPPTRPGHVDRRRRHPVLDRPRRRRPRQRPARDDPGGRPRLRHPLARPRARRRRRGRRARSSTATAPGLDRPADRSTIAAARAATRLGVYPVCTDAPTTRAATAAAVTPPRGVACPAAARLRRRARRPRRRRRADRLPQARGHGLLRRRRAEPRSRAAGSSRTRCGASRRRRWSSRAPAFEVWLPLPTFLAAIPMALLGADVRGGAVGRPVVVGALVPVLAWRLAADVAAERGLSTGRARTLAIGTGLTTAVYLPLLLHSALPDSTMPFAVLALGACLLMTRIAARPAGRAADRPAAARPRPAHRPGRADPQRGGLARPGLGWSSPGARPSSSRGAARPADRRSSPSSAGLVFAPWAIRDWVVFGSPLPGQAVANAFSRHRLRHLRLERPADPVALPRRRPGAARSRCASRALCHNLFNVLLLPGPADLAHRPRRAAVAGPRRARSARS